MLKYIRNVVAVLLLVGVLTGYGGGALVCAAEGTKPPAVKVFEKGVLYHYGKIKVVELNGTYRQMGRQYGKLLAPEIRGMYAEVVRQFTLNNIASAEGHLGEFSKRLFKLYPKRLRDIGEGMSETSGLGIDEIAVLNESFDFLISPGPAAAAPKGDRNHCSNMAVWGDYTGGGPLVMGRNFDFPAFYKNFNPYIVVVVFNPTDGSHSVAVIAHAGQIGVVQAFNDAGLVLENNDGSSYDDRQRYFGERTPFLIRDLELAFDYSTFEGLDAALKGARFHYPMVFNVAFPDRASSYEMTTFDVKRRDGEQGLLIGVNHFVHPEWASRQPGKGGVAGNSVTRYRNLAALAAKYKGNIDAHRMMAILDIPLTGGGATPPDKSIYQFVAIPASLRLWVKAPGYVQWTEIDLKTLFRKTGVAR